MGVRLLVIGLDAMEATMIERGTADGSFPAFDALLTSAAAHQLDSPMGSLPGAIWPEINTGISAETLGLYHHPCQIHTGEPVPRTVSASEIDGGLDWWNVAGDAGRRVLVVDVPHAVARSGTNGIHVTDWGNHDRSWAPASDPADALDEVRRIVGDHPIHRCDDVVAGGDADGYRRLLGHLLDGIERRVTLMETLMAREHWDAAAVAFAESHCVGHQFWAFTNAAHPVPILDPPDDLRNAVDSVYRAIDGGLARLVAAAGSDASVVVVASHGMGPYVGGYQMLPEVLVRLGLRPPPNAIAAAPSQLPRPVRKVLRRIVPDAVRWRRIARGGVLPHHDLASPRTRAAAMPNNRCGAVRLNLRGREPNGCVAPGAEADALLAMLDEELRALRDPSTKEPIVARVRRPADEAPGAPHPDLPDLTVEFRTDLGPLEACESPRVGRVEVPMWSRARRADGWPVRIGRTGDHTNTSRLWLRPGRSAGSPATLGDGRGASVRDVAPTILTLLDVAVPASVEGHTLV